jgi:dihydrolipoamide dehydrogenase
MNKLNDLKPKKYNFDLIIIGSGPGGGVAAHLAAAEGKKVGLIESHILGGDCFVNGCLPTKALLKAAETLATVQTSSKFGIRSSAISYNYRSVQAHKEKALSSVGIYNESTIFKSDGIITIRGRAHFLSPWVVSAGIKRYSAPKFFISSGATPIIPKIPGLANAGYITYKQAGHLLKQPRSLFIIGGGGTAYEYAQIFATFGTKVYVADINDHLLSREDPEVSDSAEAALNHKGVYCYTNSRVIEVSGSPGRKIVTYIQNNRHYKVAVEEVMVAIGMQPNLDLGLENAGVSYTTAGIRVNHHMATSCKHIFAAGDVFDTSVPISVQGSILQSRIAIHNMFHRQKITMNYRSVPRCYYGFPEIAVVGSTEHDLKLTGQLYQTAIAPVGVTSKAASNDYTDGFVKIIATHSGIVLGASIVAPSASEMVQELTLAIEQRHYACAVSNTLHLFSSWSEAIRIAADKIKCL